MPTKEFKQKRTKRLGELDIPPYNPLNQTKIKGPFSGVGVVSMLGSSRPSLGAAAMPYDWMQRYGGWGPHGGGAAEVEWLNSGRRGQPIFPYENPQTALPGFWGRNIKRYGE